MELKAFKGFRSSVQELPAFQSIHQKERRGFLVDAYKLAKERYQSEQWMETAREAAKSSRATSTTRLLRAATHLWNALKDIDKAKKATPTDWPKLIQHLQVQEAYELLRGAYDELGFLISVDIAAVHPHHRTGFEKQFRVTYPHPFLDRVEKRFSDMPARRARFDYLLVAALSSRLDRCRTSTGGPLRPIDRYRIIAEIFLAALQLNYIVPTVKTTLRRIWEQRSV